MLVAVYWNLIVPILAASIGSIDHMSFIRCLTVLVISPENFLFQISIQRCDSDGDNRLRVCYSACKSYNRACSASLDCSDQTLFSSEEEGDGQCTGYGEITPSWLGRFRKIYLQ